MGLIAEGGQGLIARARDRQTGQLVAVKMLTSAAAQNAEFVQRLAREQEAMLALAGTSAVAVLDLCRAPGGAPCLVMELLDGHDLEQELDNLDAASQRMPLPRMFEIFDAIVETLGRAHEVGILHRDLKPANIFLLSSEAGGGVRLLDFGLSRMKSATPLTVMGTILGSPSYIAPEVWGGRTDVLDQRVDVYSLSVVLFRVLAGRLPFGGENIRDKFKLATTAERPSLSALRPDLPREVDVWVQKALAIQPDERYATVLEAWTALLRAIRYTPTERPRARVRESLVDAWRAARGAFRRALDGLPVPAAPRPWTTPTPAPAPAAVSSPSDAPAATARRRPPPPPRRPRAPTVHVLNDLDAELLDDLTPDDGVTLSELFDEAPRAALLPAERPRAVQPARRRRISRAEPTAHDVKARRRKRRRRVQRKRAR